jgi:hypothetical protein
MRTRKKMRYLEPSVRFNIDFETEHSLLASSQIDFTVLVDPLEEHYYEGTDATSDYLIEF